MTRTSCAERAGTARAPDAVTGISPPVPMGRRSSAPVRIQVRAGPRRNATGAAFDCPRAVHSASTRGSNAPRKRLPARGRVRRRECRLSAARPEGIARGIACGDTSDLCNPQLCDGGGACQGQPRCGAQPACKEGAPCKIIEVTCALAGDAGKAQCSGVGLADPRHPASIVPQALGASDPSFTTVVADKVTVKLNRHKSSRAVRLRLNQRGRRLLRQSSRLDVLVRVTVHDDQHRTGVLQRLIHLLRGAALTIDPASASSGLRVDVASGANPRARSCAHGVRKNLTKLWGASVKCVGKARNLAFKGTVAKAACRDAATNKYDATGAKLLRHGGCPATLAASDQSALRDIVLAHVDVVDAQTSDCPTTTTTSLPPTTTSATQPTTTTTTTTTSTTTTLPLHCGDGVTDAGRARSATAARRAVPRRRPAPPTVVACRSRNNKSSPIDITADGRRVVAANTDTDTVSFFDVGDDGLLTKVHEVAVGRRAALGGDAAEQAAGRTSPTP